MGESPVVVHLDKANPRVQRTHDHEATRVFLFKDNLDVERAPVEVPGGRQCEGRTGD